MLIELFVLSVRLAPSKNKSVVPMPETEKERLPFPVGAIRIDPPGTRQLAQVVIVPV